ncbi:peptidyl-prolyl cis-trans isomerase D [Sphingomonas vulcanisoli]|uniref:Parvulin-like PPIase n=1 Tax=Sphingomonas vulcanisoli TaxID=1658060 RepID=A0ABX0TTR3_9SPHN|nr:peptidylprolyl isomerase [Sphingomonas vulcanisoli]NIJ07680.1 peptidyl-prolyl cis-trans isomerase D [Sphingomonas vulcanisoli]
MLTFFRRALGSWIVIALLGLLLVAFIVTGVSNPFGGGAVTDPNVVATVGGEPIRGADVQRSAQAELSRIRQQQPAVDMAALLRQTGGLDPIVEREISTRSLEIWARKHGLTASDRLIDAQIANIPAFINPAGKFDEKQMRALLAQQHMALADLRSGIRADLIRRQLLIPLGAAPSMPMGMARTYAGLFVARRIGEVGFVPLKPVAAPSEPDIAAWYKSHIAAYTVPERRVLRYAPINPDGVTVATPSDAEIAAQYKADAAKYAAGETRTLSQVVLPDEGAAKAFAAKLASGTPFEKAAGDAGFGPKDTALGALSKEAFAASATPAIADAAFAAKQGGNTTPLKSTLGWHIVHIDTINAKPARSLESVKGEIATALTQTRKTAALQALGQKIEDALNDGANFDKIVKANSLKVVTTPPLLGNGAAPNFQPDATVQALLKPAFLAEPEDAPTLEPVPATGGAALLGVASVLPSAPLPLAQVHDKAKNDLMVDRAGKAARAIADGVLAKMKAGTPMAAAFAAAGLEAPKPANASQIDVARLQQQGQAVSPPLRALFALSPGKTSLTPGPGGWYIVHLDQISPGDPAQVALIAGQMRVASSQGIGDEYLQQFAKAARSELTVKKNPAAIAALAKQLSGQAAADQ